MPGVLLFFGGVADAIVAGLAAIVAIETMPMFTEGLSNVPLGDLSDAVRDQLGEVLDGLPITETHGVEDIIAEERLSEVIDSVIERNLDELEGVNPETVYEALYENMVNGKGLDNVIEAYRENVKDMLPFNRNPLHWNGLTEKDFIKKY